MEQEDEFAGYRKELSKVDKELKREGKGIRPSPGSKVEHVPRPELKEAVQKRFNKHHKLVAKARRELKKEGKAIKSKTSPGGYRIPRAELNAKVKSYEKK